MTNLTDEELSRCNAALLDALREVRRQAMWLRGEAGVWRNSGHHTQAKYCDEAADTIERMREALEAIDAAEIHWGAGVDENVERLKTIARRALGSEGG